MKQMYDDYYKRYPNGRCGFDVKKETKPMPQFDTSCRDCVYAQAYVPDHKACQLFSGEDALKNGTAFPELAMPYTKGRNLKHFGGEERA